MICLGIDPGTLRLGWGVLQLRGTRLVHIAHGVLRLRDGLPLAERLVQIERGLVQVLTQHRPHEASIESLFFGKDAQAAAKLGHARGVALLACARDGLPVFEYPPSRVKRTVTGNGRADKGQIARMMTAFLRLDEQPSADAADALAIAATHLQSVPFRAVARSSASSGATLRQIRPIGGQQEGST